MQVDLVGTAQDRLRVVDDHQTFVLGAFGHAVGMMVEAGGLADEQRIELCQAAFILAGDQADVDAASPSGANELLERTLVAGRHGLLRIARSKR